MTAPIFLTPTFTHQEDGIRWMLERETTAIRFGVTLPIYGGLLCDNMGMGKTLQLTQLIVRRPVPYSLIVAPVSVLSQWRDIILSAVFSMTQTLSVYQCVSRREARQIYNTVGGVVAGIGPKILINSIPANVVVLASYGQVMIPEPKKSVPALPPKIPFEGIAWDRVILDEAQIIKNAKTLTCASARKLRATPTGSRWAVTGTPVQNRLDDVYALFKFIGVPPQLLRKKTIAAAQWLFSKLALRRTIADLPPEQVALIHFPEAFVNHEHYVKYATDDEEEFYVRATGNIIRQLERLKHYTNQQAAARCRLELINQLRFLAVHPNVYIHAVNVQRPDGQKWARWTGTVTKNNDVMNLVHGLRKRSQSFVLFTHFVEEMREYHDAIAAMGYTVYEIHGGQTAAVREREIAISRRGAASNREEISRIMEEKIPGDVAWIVAEYATPLQAMLIHIRAGGAGLNLQHFSNVIIPSPDWNPAAESQAIGRCHRIGQQHRVNVYRFYIKEVQGAMDQIELYMKNKQEEKRAIAEAVVEPVVSVEANEAGVKLVRIVSARSNASSSRRTTVIVQKTDS